MHRQTTRGHRRDENKHYVCVPDSANTCLRPHILPGSPGTEPSQYQTLVEATTKINDILEEVKNSNPPQGKELAIVVEPEGLFLVWVKYEDDGEDEL